jgi:ATP-dependent DNA helicase RecQ
MTSYYSLKVLETEGYLELTDEISNPSRIYFIVGRDELYKFQVANASFDGFIKLLLRTYSGVFNGFTAIDEEFLARKSSATRDVIYQYLIRLSKLKIIQYVPRRKSPLIILNTERLDENSLYIPSSTYQSRKDNYSSRLRSVCSFATSSTRCRSVMLLEYFDEKESRPCGHCDICKKKADIKLSKYEFDIIAENIKAVIRHGNVFPDELVSMLEYPPEKSILVLRWLLDNRKIISGTGTALKWED